MSLAKFIQMLIKIDSCSDVVKEVFVDDNSIFVNVVEEAIKSRFLNKLVESRNDDNEFEYVKEQHIIASLLITSLYGSSIHLNKAIHKVLNVVSNELSGYDDNSLMSFLKLLGIDADFSDKCFTSSIYVLVKKGKQIVTKTCYRYRIRFTDYINMAKTLLTEENWRIISHPILKGYVYIDRKDKVVRLVIEYFRNMLLTKLRSLQNNCEHIKKLIDSASLSELIRNVFGVYSNMHATVTINNDSRNSLETLTKSYFESVNSVEELYKASSKFFPPCIKEILEILIKGENLSHHQRFALATFLINIGVPQDVIVDLFRRSPDFNEKITRYQIEHLAGLRGSRKRYLTYSCNTMKALGMCKWECNLKNPVQYPYKFLRNAKA